MRCKDCEARTNRVIYDASVYLNDEIYEAAANAWNTRKPVDDVLERLEEESSFDKTKELPKTDKWIPCSERLPNAEKPYKSVLLQLKKSMVVGYINKAGQWFVDTGDGWCASLDEKPIAWMPLPEPYKKE